MRRQDDQERRGEWPGTNNAVENVNARPREMPYPHRGLPLLHRVKAIFWWRYVHTENPLPASEILRVMPTDTAIIGTLKQGDKVKASADEGGWLKFTLDDGLIGYVYDEYMAAIGQ